MGVRGQWTNKLCYAQRVAVREMRPRGLCAACYGGATAASSGSTTSAASKKAAPPRRHQKKAATAQRNAAKEAEKAQKRDEGEEKWKQLLALLHVYKDKESNLKVPTAFAVLSEAP